MNTACFLSIPAMMFPEKETLVFKETRLTYSELLNRVNRLTNALRSLGLGRHSRVGILETNSNEYVEAYYATSKLEGIFVPLNYRVTYDELKHMIDVAGLDAIVVGDRYINLVRSLMTHFPSMMHRIALRKEQEDFLFFDDLIGAASNDSDEEDADEDQTNTLMFTSGTTSMPKAVMLSYGNFVKYVFETTEPPGEVDAGSTLLCAPLYHIAGLTAIMTSVYGGRRLVLMSQFDAKEWLHLVQKESITNAFLVPTMLKKLLDEPDLANTDLSNLQVLSYGAAPMPLAVIRQAIDVLPKHISFINAFGQTETTATVTMLLPEDHRLEGPTEEIDKKLKRLTSIGRPLPGVQVKITDGKGRELPGGEVGEIMIRTSRLMKGYERQDPQQEQPIVDGWLDTSDMGWADEDGYVFLAGRKDDMIIRGGENVAPAEIESVLEAHPAVEEACVIGYPDEEWGETVMAALVLKDGLTAKEGEIIDFCRKRLASFKTPKRIEFVESLPRNALGKVLRKILKAEYVRG